ncbi:NADH-dependent [FeFe] hydrogenase, group A6 [Oceanirhabdus sp. W0125-5]|uniref:NADH-dependent [FeFe] hydrogenase, group A6 n=1 Tax=Oceanirhabdus sp. W0125-5 TaxID=2999116 RepID=UPI0022F2C6C0|nr:NADH-dependent [FeFe] hydrogenase, group A6 [Oceanirhabdus sp. W0125-5]WBW98205.1 NADH-dependent [FeFe] hydrogenase, group A6 [Oceanirhabdus sp. W0125-5]
MNQVTLTINGRQITVDEGATILEAANKLNINIPTLCYFKLHDDRTINDPGSCRVCVVEVEGRRNLAPACSTPVTEGMNINSNSIRAIKARRGVVELLLSDHPHECLLCEKNLNCELQSLAAELGVRELPYQGKKATYEIDNSSYSIIRDMEKCVYCRRCETMCNEVQQIGVLSGVYRGFNSVVAPAFNLPMAETNCTFCGQCVSVCPTASLTEVHYIPDVWNALNDKDKYVVVQTAPAIRVALGEEFGYEPGTIVTGKMVAALRALGFDNVFDTDFAADLTIMEEASEFVHRLQHGGKLPILTSCCPGWIQLLEHSYPDMLDIPSTCKSPHQMFGAITKTYFAEKMNIDPSKIVVVSVMPCLAKKFEAHRPEMQYEGNRDVDIVISTRELAKMIREAGIDFISLEDEDFDNPLGVSSGAGDIFAASGGVLEAAVRTAAEMVTGKSSDPIEFKDVRGYQGIKEASIDVDGTTVKVAVTNGLGNARKILDDIKTGKAEYHIIEIMACPGGCIGGGGQPYIYGDSDILKKRIEAIYIEDANKELRKSHENPYIKKLYDEYIGEVYGAKAHELLHTHYTPKKMGVSCNEANDVKKPNTDKNNP